MITVVKTFPLHSIVKVAPGSVLAERCQEIVLGLIEVEVVILVEKDGHRAITRHLARLPHHLGDAGRILDAVAVQEKEIRGADDVLLRNGAAAVAGADEEALAVAGPCFHALDQLVHALRLEDVVIVARHIALVVDLDDHVAIASLEQPSNGAVYTRLHRVLVFQAFVLAEIVDAQDDDHAELVGLVEDALKALHVVGSQAAVLLQRGVVPRL